MKAHAAAIVGWTVVSLLTLIFDPGFSESVVIRCMRLVGRSDACAAQQQSINDAWQWLHVYPLLASVAAGYIAIAALNFVGRRRRDR